VSTTGLLERCTPAPGDDVVGLVETDGTAHLYFGFPFTVIALIGAIAGLPDYSFQYRKPDGSLGGLAHLIALLSGEVNHLGTPIHQEKPLFYNRADDPNATPPFGFTYADWNTVQTTDATPTRLLLVSLPAATYGDGIFTIQVTIAACTASATGGEMSSIVTVQRVGGVLTVIHEEFTTVAANLTAALTYATSKVDNDSVEIKGTGLMSTHVTWTPAVFVKLARKT